MVAAATPTKLGGLARMLVQEKRLTEREAETIQSQANTQHVPFVTQLVQSKKLSAMEAAEAASSAFGFPLLDLNTVNPDYLPKKAIDAKLMQSYRVMALQSRGNTLFIALSDPTNLHALDDVQFQVGMALSPVVVEDDKLGKWISRIVDESDTTLQSFGTDDDIELDFQNDAESPQTEVQSTEIDDAPVVKYLQKTLLDAIRLGASDLHFEPYEKYYRIRYRVDGVLREIARPPLVIKDKIASRIKVISNMDISEKRVPQDGRMKLSLSKTRAIDFRVSTLPTLQGEKIVMRILDPSSATLGIDALGYDPDQKESLLHAIKRPYGMVLVTGPTGSGKTVSLYTCLNILNEPGVNISTAEDPAEINLPGVNQVNVNEWLVKSATWKRQISPSRLRRPATWYYPPCTPTMRLPRCRAC
jgi:type IV pilus assembly protein PilB